jgi:ribosomal protein S18 acetylase RimI-like enzyme
MQSDIQIKVGLQPDTVEKLLNLHASLYIREHGFDRVFEGEVGRQLLDAIARSERNPEMCNVISAVKNGATIGAIVIDGNEPGKEPLGAHFRWFFVDPEFTKAGIGPRVIEAAMEFVISHRLSRAYLTTYKDKPAARTTFRRLGFKLIETIAPETQGAIVDEELWIWKSDGVD